MGVRPVFETPYERGGVITPGLPVLPHGVERHPVPGGGSRAVRIDKGDEISVLDREGLQCAELVFFTPDGRSDAGMIGAKGRGSPTGLQAALASGDASGRRVLKALDAAGFDIGRADAARVFGEGSRPGDMATFQAASDGLLIVCAPGGPMAPGEQNPPTEIILYVRRADPGEAKGGLAPPEPLADPLA
ncbi:MAG: aminomethyltransferase, partial [Paracoccaceae bacterium]